jgi:glucuronosyltransferase
MLKMEGFWFNQQIQFYWDIGIKLCELFIQDETFQKLINSKGQKFDILITSAFIYDCVFGISYMLDIPIIKMCPFGGIKWMDEWIGNPTPYAYLPQLLSDYGDRMNFWQRTFNTISEIYIRLGRIFYVIPKHDAILRKYFNSSNFPSISVLEKSTALLLINQHFSTWYPRPLMPNTVEVGGIHINPPKKLNAVSMCAYTFCRPEKFCIYSNQIVNMRR